MTETVAMITQIMTGITLLAMIWLSARAFLRGTAWGLGVLLFAPLVGTAFGIRYWKEERLPFLAFLSALFTTLVLAVYLFGAWGGWEMLAASRSAEQALQMQTLTRADADAFVKASTTFAKRSGIKYEDQQLAARIRHKLAQDAEKKALEKHLQDNPLESQEYKLEDIIYKDKKKKERYRLVYKQIKVGEAAKYVGSTVKLVRRGALEKEYRLVGIGPGTLKLLQSPAGGTYSFSLKHADIEKLRVLTRENY